MIYVKENKALLCKGDYHPAELYKGETRLTGFTRAEFSGEGGATLENCYNDKLYDAQIIGNSVQDGTPSPENPIEIQSVGELVTEGDDAGKYKIPVKARGKNLFDYTKYSYSKKTSNGLICEHIGNGVFHIYGTITTYSKWINFQYSGVQGGIFKQGKKYKSKFFGTKGNGLSILLGIANAQDIQITNLTTGLAAFTMPSEGCYIRYVQVTCSYMPEGTTYDEYIQLQLEEETFTDTYEPYMEPQPLDIYLGEPLRKAGIYSDYIDFEQKKVMRNVLARTFKGTEYWQISGDNFMSYDLYPYATNGRDGAWANRYSIGAICNRFKAVSGMSLYSNGYNQTGNICCGLNSDGHSVGFIPSAPPPTVAEWKATLAQWNEEGTPLVIYHGVNTKEEELELPEIPTFKGTTIYEIDTSVEPSGMEVYYY